MTRARLALVMLVVTAGLWGLAVAAYGQSAQTSPVVTPDIHKAGETLATLNDWRAIVFILAFAFVVLIAERFVAAWGMRQERKELRAEREALQKEMSLEREKMWKVADKFGDAADKVGEGLDKVAIQLEVLRALAARVESNTGDGR